MFKTYSREKDLRCLVGSFTLTEPNLVLQGLTLQENDLENARECGSARYDMKHCITNMAALLQELFYYLWNRMSFNQTRQVRFPCV